MDGLVEDEFVGIDRPKVCEKILCLYSSSLKVYGTKASGPLRLELCILDPESMFKQYDMQRVQSLEGKLEDLDSLSLNYWLANSSKKLLMRTVVGIRAECLIRERFLIAV